MNAFIVLEGLDGAGKSTQIRLLADALRAEGERVFCDVEPTGAETGRLLRRILSGEVPSSPWATAALFLSDRINQNTDPENGIRRHLLDGETVILDRYYFSTFAYQGYETSLEWTTAIHYGCPALARPDLVVFLTMDPETCIDRITKNRGEGALEIYETAERLTRVRRQFEETFKYLGKRENVAIVDASGSVEEVHARVMEAVKTRLRPKKRLVLFDFDGTLADNSEGIFNSIRYALGKMDLPVPDGRTLRTFIGPSLFDSYRRVFGGTDEDGQRFVTFYREFFAPTGKDQAKIYPGIPRLLRSLSADGVRVAVCSSKPGEFVTSIAKKHGIYDLFDAFFCPGFAMSASDKTDLIREGVKHFGLAPGDALMVGDTKYDVEAAKNAGVQSLGVRYGFAAAGELEAAGADLFADDPAGIYEAVTGKTL